MSIEIVVLLFTYFVLGYAAGKSFFYSYAFIFILYANQKRNTLAVRACFPFSSWCILRAVCKICRKTELQSGWPIAIVCICSIWYSMTHNKIKGDDNVSKTKHLWMNETHRRRRNSEAVWISSSRRIFCNPKAFVFCRNVISNSDFLASWSSSRLEFPYFLRFTRPRPSKIHSSSLQSFSQWKLVDWDASARPAVTEHELFFSVGYLDREVIRCFIRL